MNIKVSVVKVLKSMGVICVITGMITLFLGLVYLVIEMYNHFTLTNILVGASLGVAMFLIGVIIVILAEGDLQ